MKPISDHRAYAHLHMFLVAGFRDVKGRGSKSCYGTGHEGEG